MENIALLSLNFGLALKYNSVFISMQLCLKIKTDACVPICSAMDLRTSPKHTLGFGFTPVISGGNLFSVVNKCSSWKPSAWGGLW